MKTIGMNRNNSCRQGVNVDGDKYKLVELAKSIVSLCIIGACSLVGVYSFLTALAELR